MSVELFGDTPLDTQSKENDSCRQIVREIISFGVNQRQIYLLMYLLSLELENVEHMRDLSVLLSVMRRDMRLSSPIDQSVES